MMQFKRIDFGHLRTFVALSTCTPWDLISPWKQSSDDEIWISCVSYWTTVACLLDTELFPPEDMEGLAVETKLAWGNKGKTALTQLSPAWAHLNPLPTVSVMQQIWLKWKVMIYKEMHTNFKCTHGLNNDFFPLL